MTAAVRRSINITLRRSGAGALLASLLAGATVASAEEPPHDPLGDERWLCSPGAMTIRARADEPDDAAKRRRRFEALVARSPRLPSLGLYSPAEAERSTLQELGPSPEYWRQPQSETRVGVRAAFALAVQLNGQPSNRIALGLDVAAYGRIGIGRGESYWALWPEAGYAFASNEAGERHLGVAGVGLTFQRWDYSVGYLPRFAGGTVAGETALGLRHSVLGGVARGLLALELGHTWLDIDNLGTMHNFDARISVDFAGIVAAAVGDYDPTATTNYQL